jgi:hypothetical protein
LLVRKSTSVSPLRFGVLQEPHWVKFRRWNRTFSRFQNLPKHGQSQLEWGQNVERPTSSPSFLPVIDSTSSSTYLSEVWGHRKEKMKA